MAGGAIACAVCVQWESVIDQVIARVFAEPVIGRAIAFEDGHIGVLHALGVHEHGADLFTLAVQANAGLGFGVLIFGIAMGALLPSCSASLMAVRNALDHKRFQ